MNTQDQDHRLDTIIEELDLSEDELAFWSSYEIQGLGAYYHEFGPAAAS